MKSVEDIIIETLPEEMTEAIYLFGSYGTQYFDEASSDIDIGWFTNTEMDWFEAMAYRDQLEEKLGREVDLLVNEKKRFNITYNILSGKPIGKMSDEFCEWFDEFVGIAMEEARYLQNIRREREELV